MTGSNSGDGRANVIPPANNAANPPPAGSPPAGASFVETIPEGYRTKEWAVQNAKDPDTFYKWVDNLNTTVGKKGVIVPGENATPEEVNSYFKGIGRPDKAEDYVFENIEEMKDAKRDDVRALEFKKLLYDSGVPKDMAVKLQKGVEKMAFGEQSKAQAAQAKIDEEFNKSVTKTFGDRKGEVLSGVKKLLAENTTPETRVKLEQLDNDTLVIVASAIDGIARKYIGEDPYTGGKGHIPSGAESYESLSAQQREVMGQPGFTDFRHPEHQKLMQKNNDLMKRMREFKK